MVLLWTTKKEKRRVDNIEHKLSNTLFIEKGFTEVKDNYFINRDERVFNRSNGTDSNFFVFLKRKEGSLTIFYTNPIDKGSYLDLKKEKILVSYKLGPKSEGEISEIVNEIMEFSSYKNPNEYTCFLHSHLGKINGEAIWGDGISDDKNWIRQSMLWNCDYHALTEHNWTQGEERLNFLKDRLNSAGIVLIPGWENTTTVTDLVKSPHILVYCADIKTAMKAKYEFLSKKLEKKTGYVTPILSGVPLPFDTHIEYLRGYQEKGEMATIIPHPFSTLPGIDIFDPAIISLLGYEKCWEISWLTTGIEKYNGLESHNLLNFNMPDEKKDCKTEVLNDLRLRLSANKLPVFLSPPMLNYYFGLVAEKQILKGEKPKWAIYGHDDHYVPDISANVIGAYGLGFTKYTIPFDIYNALALKKRKPNSEEFVYSMAKGSFPDTNKTDTNQVDTNQTDTNKTVNSQKVQNVSFKAIAYSKMTPKGPDTIKERKNSKLSEINQSIRFKAGFYFNIAKLQVAYWFSSKGHKERVAKELAKAKAYQLRVK